MDLVDLDGQSINDPVVNNDVEVPTVNSDFVLSDDDDDAGLQETLRIFEETVEYNKRERSSRKWKREQEEEEFENVDFNVLNAIVDVVESMDVDGWLWSTCTYLSSDGY